MTPPSPRGRALPLLGRALAGALALNLLAAACGGGSDGESGGTTTIRFANWADAEPATQPGIRALIAKFEQTHPNIKIKSEPISFTDIEHQLILQTQSGNAPDVAELAGNYTFTVAETKALQPLDELAGPAYKQSIIPEVLKLGQVNGELIGAPWTVAPIGLWYNKKVLKDAGLDPAKPPATWTELLAAARTIHQKNPKTIAFGLDTTNRPYGLDTNWPIMKSFGAQPFQGSNPTADSPGMKAYLNFMREIAKNGYTPINQKAGFFRQPAASDQVAFTVDGPYVKGVVQDANKATDEQFYDTWGVAPLPTATGQHFSAPTDHQLVLFKDSKKHKAAWEFMKFLTTSPEGVDYILDAEGSLPPVRDLTGDGAKRLDNPIMKSFREAVIPKVARPEWGSNYAKAYSPIMSGIQATMTGSQPIDSVAANLQSTLKSEFG